MTTQTATKENQTSKLNAEKKRCAWGNTGGQAMRDYHDFVWGKFTADDTELFEYLTLEVFQAGLSWATILKRQAAFKEAFLDYDLVKISQMTEQNVEELLSNPEIIRNRLKINATINNAKIVLGMQKEFGSFNNFLTTIWPDVVDNQPVTDDEIPANSEAGINFSKQLKKAGLKFIGPTIAYSFLEATGRINDHLVSCAFKY